MNKLTPEIHKDGSETVELYGQIIDVTDKKELTLFKKHYVINRPKVEKPKKQKQITKEDE